jgi:uncharacterized protein YbjT (DUF2867 family)
MTAPVLVTGASGAIGRKVVEALRAQGLPVRAMSRRPEQLAHLLPLGVEVVAGDVLDRASLKPALAGVERAFYLVHSMGAPGSERTFAEWDRHGAHNFALEGRHLERIVYLGGLGRPEDTLSPHLRSRWEVGEIFLGGHAPATVLRAGIVIGQDSVSFVMLLSLVKRLPVMVCPRWVLTRTQPIAVSDAVTYLVRSLHHPQAAGQDLEIGGPDVLTYRDMLMRTASVLGRRLRIVTVPVLTPQLSALWMDLVTPIPASIAHPLIEGLRNEVVVRDDRAQRLIPFPLTSFEDAVRTAMKPPPA